MKAEKILGEATEDEAWQAARLAKYFPTVARGHGHKRAAHWQRRGYQAASRLRCRVDGCVHRPRLRGPDGEERLSQPQFSAEHFSGGFSAALRYLREIAANSRTA